ncbi:MAG: hypothetical protein AAGA15_10965, partial [Pseudomonadota bacterium]
MVISVVAACAQPDSQDNLFRMTFAISSEEDGERFIGEAIGVADQSGIFRMVSQTGLVCDGT